MGRKCPFVVCLFLILCQWVYRLLGFSCISLKEGFTKLVEQADSLVTCIQDSMGIRLVGFVGDIATQTVFVPRELVFFLRIFSLMLQRLQPSLGDLYNLRSLNSVLKEVRRWVMSSR
jgi:hypothetical protein